jgi:enoyl-CoA hydratase/carnithine racemase
MSTKGIVFYDLRDRVAWLGLNRPDKRNAIPPDATVSPTPYAVLASFRSSAV